MPLKKQGWEPDDPLDSCFRRNEEGLPESSFHPESADPPGWILGARIWKEPRAGLRWKIRNASLGKNFRALLQNL